MGFLGRATFNFFHAAIGFATVLLYPLYESKRAMEKPLYRDHQQWLTYWVLLSFLTLFELYLSSIISWLPLWPYIKLMVCLWLELPSFKGAAYVYENIAMKFMNIESEERPEYNFVEAKKKVKEEKVKEDDKDKEGDKDKEDEDEDEDDDIDIDGNEEKKIFRAWKLVDDFIEKYGADSLEKIVKTSLQAAEANKQAT